MIGTSKARVVIGTSKVLVIAAVAALTLIPLAVEATPYASSVIEVTNVDFDGPGFSSFFFRENQTSATLNDTTQSSAGNIIKTTQVPLDQPLSCVGNCGSFVNNTFFPTPNINVIGGSYAILDSHMLTTAINPPGGDGTGRFGSRTQARLNGAASGSAQTGTDNTMQWNFIVTGPANNDIALDFDLVRNYHLHTDDIGELASATINLLVQLIPQQPAGSPTTLLSLQLSNTLSQLAGPADEFPLSDFFVHIGLGMNDLANGSYQLRINFGTSADVLQSPVPEPATMSVLGLGLVGVAYLSRRRHGQ